MLKTKQNKAKQNKTKRNKTKQTNKQKNRIQILLTWYVCVSYNSVALWLLKVRVAAVGVRRSCGVFSAYITATLSNSFHSSIAYPVGDQCSRSNQSGRAFWKFVFIDNCVLFDKCAYFTNLSNY